MPFKHDSRGIDPDAPTILLMPDGWYTFKIKEAEETTSKNGNDMIICKCAPVGEPQYAEALLWHYVTFLDKDAPGAGISVQFRKVIGVPYGGEDIVDAEDWVGKKFMGYVTRADFEGKKGKITRNKITMIKSIEEAEAEKKAGPALKVANGGDDDIPF